MCARVPRALPDSPFSIIWTLFEPHIPTYTLIIACSIRAGTNYTVNCSLTGLGPRKPYIDDRWSSRRHVMVEETKDTPGNHSGSVNGAAEGIRTREAQRPLVFQPSSICDGWRARRAVAVMKGLHFLGSLLQFHAGNGNMDLHLIRFRYHRARFSLNRTLFHH